MKKNLTIKVGAVLMALTLITSCFVGSTFAKYTTSAEGTDKARVAKFGVEITANGTTFATTYTTDKEEYAETITNSVVATDNVVAPGTEGNMVAMTISGKPEVAVEVAYKAKVQLENWTVNDEYYCPIIITVGEKKLKGTDYNDADSFIEAIENAISDFTAQYAPGTDLSITEGTEAISVPNVSWEWPFETVPTTEVGAQADDAENCDEKDTALGNAETAAAIYITVTTTVTQID